MLADDQLFAAVAASPGPLEISDVTRHPELSAGTVARGPLGVRLVYGIPLRSRQSTLLGVLCVLDRRPRELSTRERQAVSAVSRQVAGQLALWRRSGASSAEPSNGVDQARTAASVESAPDRRRLHLHREGEELLRSHEVAVLFDVTDRTVINWAAANKLPSIRTAGGHLRFRGEDVFALLAGRPVRTA